MSEEIIQGTAEWLTVRLGKVTASRVADVVARTKTGWGAGRANYMAELICERLTGQAAEKFSSAAMQWGTQTEPEARDIYAFMHDAAIEQVGFVHHSDIAMSGASPDGLVNDHGLVELTCPNTATHIETLLSGKVPEKYVMQMMWQMAATGRRWCDFVSHDPRMPVDMRMFVRRIERDDTLIAELDKQVIVFLGELDEKIANLLISCTPQKAAA